MAAARALAMIGQGPPEALQVLMAAARESKEDAIALLGKLGSQAEAATPLLLELARTSTRLRDKREALSALVAIGCERPTVLELVAAEAFPAAGKPTRERYNAITLLGKFGADARPFVPQMIALLDQQATFGEMTALLQVWVAIAAPLGQVSAALERIERKHHNLGPAVARCREQLPP
jgi:hypothetical protein